MQQMTKQQSDQQLLQMQATYSGVRDGTEWWRLKDGRWVGRRTLPNGNVEMRMFGANACNC